MKINVTYVSALPLLPVVPPLGVCVVPTEGHWHICVGSDVLAEKLQKKLGLMDKNVGENIVFCCNKSLIS